METKIDAQCEDEFLYQWVSAAEAVMMQSLEEEAAQAPEHVFSRRFERRMNRLVRMERLGVYRHGVARARAAGAAVFVAAGVMLAAVLSVEASRVKLVEWFREVTEKYTMLRFEPTEQNTDGALEAKLPAYVPAGYRLDELITSDIGYRYFYRNDDGMEIMYRQGKITAGGMLLDTEDAKTTAVRIGEWEAMLVEKNGYVQLVWNDDRYMYFLSGNVDASELLKMAESL